MFLKNLTDLLGENNGAYVDNNIRQTTQTMQVCNQILIKTTLILKNKYKHK